MLVIFSTFKHVECRHKREIDQLSTNTPFAVHYGKIRIHLRQSSVNKTNIHSFARSGNHLRETYIPWEFCMIAANECVFCRNEQEDE